MPETPQNRPQGHAPSGRGQEYRSPATARFTVDGRPERRSGSAADRSAHASRQTGSYRPQPEATPYGRDADAYRKRVQADRASRPAHSGVTGRNERQPGPTRQQHAPRANARYANDDRYLKKANRSTSLPVKPALIGIAVLACIVIGIVIFVQSRPISVIVNGEQLELGGSKDIAAIIEAGYASPKTGDFVAVDGEVLEAGKGEAFTAYVNSKKTNDPKTNLKAGDVVIVADGANAVEPSQDTVETVPYEVIQEGNGPLHVIEGKGVDGSKTTKIGDISGKTFVEDIAPQNPVCRQYYPDTGDDKVVALTFDDGPWPDSTGEVLDILAENDVKATFFTVGNRIDDNGKALVKRAHEEGHQICTHTFDHASGDGNGVDLGLMSAEQQIEEVTKGYDAIEAAIGEKPSTVIRAPGGNFNADVQKNLAPYISAEIGWNIDSSDWRLPGADSIAAQIEGAWPGAVILCHDGGGDRSQTIAAIREAIPYLKEQGYTFVTIDEMMEYPAKPMQS